MDLEQATAELDRIRSRQPKSDEPTRLAECTGEALTKFQSSARSPLPPPDPRLAARLAYAKAGWPPRVRKATQTLVPRETCSRGPSGGSWWDVHDLVRERIGSGMLIGLCGTFGSGKTVLSACIGWYAAESGLDVRYTTAPKFFRELLAGMRDGYEADVIRDHARVGFLVIDEAHEKANTDYEDRRLNEIIDLRYGQERDTLLISNLDRSEFASSLGPGIIDRMAQCGGLIECDWPSFRKQT